jgi:hypothetical protein
MRLADVQVPATALLKGTIDAYTQRIPEDQRPKNWRDTLQRVLVMQAEETAGGQVTYGIVEQHAMRAASADELTDVRVVMAELREP